MDYLRLLVYNRCFCTVHWLKISTMTKNIAVCRIIFYCKVNYKYTQRSNYLYKIGHTSMIIRFDSPLTRTVFKTLFYLNDSFNYLFF